MPDDLNRSSHPKKLAKFLGLQSAKEILENENDFKNCQDNPISKQRATRLSNENLNQHS